MTDAVASQGSIDSPCRATREFCFLSPFPFEVAR
jgi:hypothetical protein